MNNSVFPQVVRECNSAKPEENWWLMDGPPALRSVSANPCQQARAWQESRSKLDTRNILSNLVLSSVKNGTFI